MHAVATAARDIIATARARVAALSAASSSSSSDVDDDFFQPALSQLPTTLATGDEDDEARDDGRASPPRSTVVAPHVEVIDLLDDDDDDDDDDDEDGRRMVERRDADADAPSTSPPTRDWDEVSEEGTEEYTMRQIGETGRARSRSMSMEPNEIDDAEASPPAPPTRDWDEASEEGTEEYMMRRMRELKRPRSRSMTVEPQTVEPDASDDDDGTFPPPPCAPREAFQRTTAILDESLRRDVTYGAALRVAFDCTRQLGGDKEILYAYESLPLERSIEWRYHEPTTSEARDAPSAETRGVQSARYTMVLLDGQTFLNMIDGECEGLKKMVETFRASRRDARRHTLCLVVEAPEKRVAHKERRACDYENPTAGWTREKYDARVAQILVQYENVVYAALPNMDACVERVCVTHAEIAKRRNEKPISMIQFLGEKAHDYMDGTTQRKPKDAVTPSDYFLRALTRISGVTAPHARGVVARYRTMDALMRAYADPTTSVADKRRMLENIMPLAAVSRDGTASRPGGKNRFGPAKSARVYDFFKPLARDDADRILSRCVQDA